MSLSDVVNSRYHGFSYWYFSSSRMSSRTSGSPPSKEQTITEERARLSRTAFTSSVGMSTHLFFTCQQLQNEQVKLQRRDSSNRQSAAVGRTARGAGETGPPSRAPDADPLPGPRTRPRTPSRRTRPRRARPGEREPSRESPEASGRLRSGLRQQRALPPVRSEQGPSAGSCEPGSRASGQGPGGPQPPR